MEKKKQSNFIFIILAIIIGSGIYREYDFEKGGFKNIWLAIIYIVTFLSCVVVIIKNIISNRKQTDNN